MIGQHSITTGTGIAKGPGRRGMVTSGAILAALLVAAAWQGRMHQTTSTAGDPGATATGPAPAAASVVDLRGAVAAPRLGDTASVTGSTTSYLYIVDSQDEAAFIREFSRSVDQARLQTGAALVQTAVVVAPSIGQEALQYLPGTPGTRITDLRMPGGTSTSVALAP